MSALTEYLDAWCSQLSLDLQKSYKNKVRGRSTNSRLEASIEPFHVAAYDSYTIGIKLNAYYVFVDGGRKPGDVSQKVDLKAWMRIKGIDPRKRIDEAREAYRNKHVKKKRVQSLKKTSYQTAAKSFEFLIKRKLKREGYEGNNFYSSVVTPERVASLQKTVSDLFQKQINVELNN